jgi:hypothetical protein
MALAQAPTVPPVDEHPLIAEMAELLAEHKLVRFVEAGISR